MRTVLLAVALAFVVAFFAMTVHTVARSGVDVLTALSALVLVLFGVGIVGALGDPPQQ
jgi:hypothetical protein